MIGGRVLDVSSLLAFIGQRSVYMSAVVWTATEEDVVLLVPSTAVAVGGGLEDDARAVLDVLLGLPVTVVDDLTVARAREIGALAAEYGWTEDLPTAHAARCAIDRGWPLITVVPDRYAAVRGRVDLEELP